VPERLIFNLEYSRMPGGTCTNEVTEIFVPKRRYRNAYSVSVAGGKQLPSHNEQAVLISNDSGATTVKVEITPAD
jgi:hypothetical protein